VMAKELARSLIKDRGEKLNFIIVESYKKSMLKNSLKQEMELYQSGSKNKEPFIV
jgi:hypothetical protein